MDYKIILYVIFGILPSLTWLSYYLRKDVHPESNKMVLKIFLWGALVTLPTLFVQIGFKKILEITSSNFGLPGLDHLLELSLSQLTFLSFIAVSIYWFFIISFTEEIFKYLVVRTKVFSSPELDEPLDIMLYMVIAALGFAALENILYLFCPTDQMAFNDVVNRTILVSFVRFIGATFLHTLCSGILGYFIALSICETKKKWRYVAYGILISVGLHGLYDFSIMTMEGLFKIVTPILILIVLAFLVFSGFEKLKKMKGICKLN